MAKVEAKERNTLLKASFRGAQEKEERAEMTLEETARARKANADADSPARRVPPTNEHWAAQSELCGLHSLRYDHVGLHCICSLAAHSDPQPQRLHLRMHPVGGGGAALCLLAAHREGRTVRAKRAVRSAHACRGDHVSTPSRVAPSVHLPPLGCC